MKPGKTYYLLLLLLVTFFWGITFPLIKNSLQYIGPVDFLAVRFSVSAALMVPLVVKRGRPHSRKTLTYGLVAGFLLFLGYYFQTVGLMYTTPAKSGIITGLYVVLLPFISYTYLRIRTERSDVIASVIAFAGLIIMSAGELGNSTVQYGDLMTLVCAVAYAYQIAYVSKHSPEIDSVHFTFYQLLFVSLFSIAALPTYEPYRFVFNSYVIFTIIFTAVFAGVFAIYITNRALIFVEPSAAGVIFVGEPVFAAIFSVILTHDYLSYYTIGGGSLMVFAMFIITYRKYITEKNRKRNAGYTL